MRFIFISLFYARVAADLSFTGLQIIGSIFVEHLRFTMNLYSSSRHRLNTLWQSAARLCQLQHASRGEKKKYHVTPDDRKALREE